MVLGYFMRATYGEHIGAIEQPGFTCQVVLNAEFNAERSWADEVDLGGTPEVGNEQSGDVASEADSGQATDVSVNNHRPLAR
jgi:hypothetical protein